jgi:uncharacterized protein
MLTREHAIAEFKGGRVVPDRLQRRHHARYADYAERMLAIYRGGIGQTRRALHTAIRTVFAAEPDCPARRIDAFCKLLDDASIYSRDRRGEAAELRRQVFRLAATRHPLVTSVDQLFEHSEVETKAHIAAELCMPWEEIDARLFSDIIEFQRLREFAGFVDGPALLARYNVAQAQAALFDAVEMTVWASEDFKTILRYAKLARLLHSVKREGDDRYVIRLDGPASMLRKTNRYGAALARFLPALLACRGWRMHAVLRVRGREWMKRFDLSPADGLVSQLPSPAEFDSNVEAAFAEQWGDGPRDGWTLVREGEILCREQQVFVPDFVLRHDDGRRVLFEIVGFWTPEYLEDKLQTLRRFSDERILVALVENTRHPALADKIIAEGLPTIRYKTRLTVKSVLAAISASDGA